MVIATKNPGKRAEVLAVLGTMGEVTVVDDVDWPDVAETGDTLEANALLKARAVAAATGCTAIADDTGLEVVALDGAPGVHTARFAGPDATDAENVAVLLQALDGETDRRARFRTAIAVVTPSGDETVVFGELAGRIATEARGTDGFGYDPVFEVDGSTLAEMGVVEKVAISHRTRALRALGEWLARR